MIAMDKEKLWVQSLLGFLQLLLILPAYMATGNTYKRQATPKIVSTNSNVTVHRGGTAVLKCVIENLGPKTVVWRKDDDEFPLTIGEMTFSQKSGISVAHGKLSGSRTQWNLIIKDVDLSSAGLYECQISAKQIFVHHIRLTVLDIPEYHRPGITLNGTQYVDLDQRIHLLCNATGVERSPEDVDWFHEGHLINTQAAYWQNRIRMRTYKPKVPGHSLISELTIDRSIASDQGNYVCRSSDLITTNLRVHVLNADTEPRRRGTKGQPDHSRQLNSGCMTKWSFFGLFLTVAIVMR